VEYIVEGLWLDTILYEIPLLALTSQAYFMFTDKDWDYANQEEKAYRKGCTLLQNGCVFSEFGSRRRRDYHTQDLVMKGLSRAAEEGKKQGWPGVMVGTSNVHFAMKYNTGAVGTVAHEWYMTIAAITDDYENSNELALSYWLGCFGEGVCSFQIPSIWKRRRLIRETQVLGIALTDTFGTPAFLDAFRKPISAPNGKGDVKPNTITYAQSYAGVRQDSGDPTFFVKMVRDFYDSQGITDTKTIVFSDSLDIEHCLEYKTIAEEAGFKPTFGVGTFFTSKLEFAILSHRNQKLTNSQMTLPTNQLVRNPSPSTSLSRSPPRMAVRLSSLATIWARTWAYLPRSRKLRKGWATLSTSGKRVTRVSAGRSRHRLPIFALNSQIPHRVIDIC
jgi:nicotinate phosphoribosyltransferase